MNTSFCHLLISFFVVSCNHFEYTFPGEKRGPEDFTDFGKALRASFFSSEGVFKRVTQNNKKEMSKWQKEVFIMPADLQSESERIHYLGSKPKK